MCILCVIQKWSRTVATMLPWLAIPLIGFWALSQLLPPAFRFEITSPRLACVFVLLVTLFWYEILMPQLSVWRAKRSARVRDRKRFEAIELQKLRKSAIRRCRNCLTAYKDQNPGGGKFMCSYCGHISKRPVLDLNVPPGMGFSKSGILKGLMGRSGKIFDRNEWICGQDCLSEKSCSRVLIFFSKACKAFFLSIIWLWRKIFRISSSRDDVSTDAERRGVLDESVENAGNCPETKSDRARRKAEEKRQARLEKELLEEEERKQREEIAKLVEERRKLRDEKMESEKQNEKESPSVDRKKEGERKRQERKKDKDRSSSKSNSDVEEFERKFIKENERHRNHHRGNVGTGYLDRMKGTNVHKLNSSYRRESSQPDRATGKRYMNADQNKNTINRHVLIEPPKKSWQQLFTHSSSVAPASSPSVIGRPTQGFNNPINFPRIGENPAPFLPEGSEIFDPASLLGPVSESLDNFQLDIGFVENPSNRPSPIKSPMSRSRVPEDDLSNEPGIGTWHMWSSSPLGPDSVGLFGGSAKWFLPHELIGAKKEDPIQPVPPKTMASLFKRDNNFIPPVSANSYGNPLGCASANQFDISTANCWIKKEGEVGGSGKSSMTRPPIIGLYSSADVPSVWAYD